MEPQRESKDNFSAQWLVNSVIVDLKSSLKDGHMDENATIRELAVA